MNLQEVFDFINFIINKEQSGKFISPEEFTLLLRNNSIKFFKKYYDVPEEYQVGQPLSRIQWEITIAAKKRLQRFMITASAANGNALTVDSDGFADLPDDIFYYDYFNTDLGVGRIVKGYEFDSISQNPITFPTDKRPIATIRNTKIQFLPTNLTNLQFHYLRYPNEPNYDYYIDQNDNVIYLAPGETSPPTGTPPNKPSESVELDWDTESVWDIIQYILEDVGIGVDRGDVIQYANNKQVKGT